MVYQACFKAAKGVPLLKSYCATIVSESHCSGFPFGLPSLSTVASNSAGPTASDPPLESLGICLY